MRIWPNIWQYFAPSCVWLIQISSRWTSVTVQPRTTVSDCRPKISSCSHYCLLPKITWWCQGDTKHLNEWPILSFFSFASNYIAQIVLLYFTAQQGGWAPSSMRICVKLVGDWHLVSIWLTLVLYFTTLETCHLLFRSTLSCKHCASVISSLVHAYIETFYSLMDRHGIRAIVYMDSLYRFHLHLEISCQFCIVIWVMGPINGLDLLERAHIQENVWCTDFHELLISTMDSDPLVDKSNMDMLMCIINEKTPKSLQFLLYVYILLWHICNSNLECFNIPDYKLYAVLCMF